MLKKVHRFEIQLELLSGMHITGGDDTFDIGGPDSQVIKNPLNGEPYIPGSSLKGKLRSLLDLKYGNVVEDKKKTKDKYDYKIDVNSEAKDCLVLFEPTEGFNPQITRGIFRDLVLTENSKKEIQDALGERIFTEIKAENKINRFKGTADSPRFIERVPTGSCFVGYIDVMEFDGDPIDKLLDYLKEALDLLEYSFIGGSGSRGYGRVKVNCQELEEK